MGPDPDPGGPKTYGSDGSGSDPIAVPEAADSNPLVHLLSLLRAADVLNDLPAALHTLFQQAGDQLTGSTPFYSWNKNILNFRGYF